MHYLYVLESCEAVHYLPHQNYAGTGKTLFSLLNSNVCFFGTLFSNF